MIMENPIRIILSLLTLSLASPCHAEDLQTYLNRYFKGSAIQYGYGSGISSNSPRVELAIHYCASGAYFSGGRSCRPNIYASGYQCTAIQDSGKWQIVVQSGVAMIRWQSFNNGPGSLRIYVRDNGMVVDQNGNPLQRSGTAQCQ